MDNVLGHTKESSGRDTLIESNKTLQYPSVQQTPQVDVVEASDN